MAAEVKPKTTEPIDVWECGRCGAMHTPHMPDDASGWRRGDPFAGEALYMHQCPGQEHEFRAHIMAT